MGVTEEMNSILKQMMGYMMNAWDPLSMWEDILVWRANVIMEYLRKLPPDAPHCVFTPSLCYVMLARAARYQNLPEVAQEYLNMTSGRGVHAGGTRQVEGARKHPSRPELLRRLGVLGAGALPAGHAEGAAEVVHPLHQGPLLPEGAQTRGGHRVLQPRNPDGRQEQQGWEAWTSILYSSWCERRDYNEAQRCSTAA